MTIKNFSSALLLVAFALLVQGFSQEPAAPSLGTKGKSDSSGLSSLAGGRLSGLAEPISFAAKYEVEQSGQRGRLMITATIEQPYYIFSTTQPKPALPTVIEIESKGITLAGSFVADRDPELTYDMQGFEGVRVEKYRESVTWTAPITFAQVVDKSLTIDLKIDGQVCRKGQCIPIMGKTATAEFGGFYAATVASDAPYRDSKGHVDWTATLSSGEATAGSKVILTLTGTPDSEYHIYPLASGEEETNQKTIIVVTQSGTLDVGATSTTSPVKHEELVAGVLSTDYHEGAVTWTVPISIPSDKAAGQYPVSGLVGFQACKEDNCDQPLAFRFSGEIKVVDATPASEPVPMAIAAVDFSEAKQTYLDNRTHLAATQSTAELQPRQALVPAELFGYFAMAMLGGFILNFMPCVLPVIGLKVLSFIDESNGNPRRIAALNLWYTAGILSIFLGFAVMTIIVQLLWNQTISWGQQFQNFGLQLGIIILLTAMALSFMGVWEIPVPGFANHSKATELSMRQGAFGAYNKGLIATLLAIPCSGPMLGPVFALMLTQPAWVILLMFLGVGLGMSSPYIVFAAFPNAMKFLPKPGNWMITFKQFLAFPLLLAVVWFVSTVDTEYRIAALTIAVMVGLACWIVGRVPAYAETPEKLRTWIVGTAIVVASCMLSLNYLGPRDIIKWEPYNESQLKELVASGRPVLIDFTAKWCSTCQVNSLVAIETRDVADALRKHNVVPMLADWSKPNPAIAQKVQELKSNSIPLLAIYPAGDFEHPIVLPDLLAKATVLDAINKAVEDGKPTAPGISLAAAKEAPAPSKVAAAPEKSLSKQSVSKVVKSDKDPKNLIISKPVLQSVGKETGVR